MRRALLLASILLLTACSHSADPRLEASGLAATDPAASGPAASGPAAVPGLRLPAPASIPARRGSELGGPFRRDGGEYRVDLPHNEVAVSGSNDGRFTPDDNSGSNALADLAYALYEWNYPDYSEAYSLSLRWLQLPLPGTLYLAFADWERNSWEWQQLEPAAQMSMSFDPSLFNPEGRLMVAVVLLGASPSELDYLSLGLSESYPPLARLSITPGSGSAPQLVSISSDGSYDPDGQIVLYELDADGDGSYELSSGESLLEQRLFENDGEFQLSLRVTDNSGLISTDTVTLPLGIIAWRPEASGINGLSCDVIWDLNGVPAMCFSQSQVLYFCAALDARGEQWGEPVVVDDSTEASFLQSIAVVDGHPAIAYVANPSTTYELRYCRALDPGGESWGPIEYLENNAVLDRVALAVIHGHPAIAYGVEGGGHADPRYVRALDPQGSEWGDPVTCDGGASDSLAVFSEFSFRMSRLITFRDRPACIFRAGAFGEPELYYFCYSDDALGLEWPEAKLMLQTDDSGGFSAMQPLVVNGEFGPMLLAFGLVDGELRTYRRIAPSNNWTLEDTLHSIADGFSTQSVAVSIIQGNPAVMIQENSPEASRLVYYRAIDSDAQSWPASPETLSFLGDDDGSNSYMRLGELDGLPAAFTTRSDGQLTRYLKY
ncbi:hypothetical protein IT575_10190 [bacterium]|nr:hypothetical protein [bacterium]